MHKNETHWSTRWSRPIRFRWKKTTTCSFRPTKTRCDAWASTRRYTTWTRWRWASDVYQARTKSIAYYDVASEMDDIQDRNGFVGDDIHELMRNMNPDFYTQFSPSGDTKADWLCLSSTMSVPATRKWTSTNIVV